MSDIATMIEHDVRQRMRREGLDPVTAPTQVRALVAQALEEYDLRSLTESLTPLRQRDDVERTIVDSLIGLGPLQALMEDPEVEEIWLNGPDKVFVARAGIASLTPIKMTQEELRSLVDRMLAGTNRRVDLSSPFVDAALPDGSRLHVAIPDITRSVWMINIRKFVANAHRLSDLVRLGSLSNSAAAFLDACVEAGLNIVVSGATGAGKTTMLNALSASIGARERVITVEEVFELKVPLRDVVGMQCRPANLDGMGEITLRRLVKEALRMRPDRIMVGEVREAESFDLLLALNAGLPGMATIHANSAREAISKLCSLPLLAGANISQEFVVPTVASTMHVVAHCYRTPSGERGVDEIVMLKGSDGQGVIETSTIFKRADGELRPNQDADPAHVRFASRGIDPRNFLVERT